MRQMMHYVARQEIKQFVGLRNSLRRGYPSMWGQPAKAMREYEGLNNLEQAPDPIPIEYHVRTEQTYVTILRDL